MNCFLNKHCGRFDTIQLENLSSLRRHDNRMIFLSNVQKKFERSRVPHDKEMTNLSTSVKEINIVLPEWFLTAYYDQCVSKCDTNGIFSKLMKLGLNGTDLFVNLFDDLSKEDKFTDIMKLTWLRKIILVVVLFAEFPIERVVKSETMKDLWLDATHSLLGQPEFKHRLSKMIDADVRFSNMKVKDLNVVDDTSQFWTFPDDTPIKSAFERVSTGEQMFQFVKYTNYIQCLPRTYSDFVKTFSLKTQLFQFPKQRHEDTTDFIVGIVNDPNHKWYRQLCEGSKEYDRIEDMVKTEEISVETLKMLNVKQMTDVGFKLSESIQIQRYTNKW